MALPSDLRAVLATLNFPDTNCALVDLLSDEPSYSDACLKLDFAVPVRTLAASLATSVQEQCERQGIELQAVEIGQRIAPASAVVQSQQLSGVKNIIAVASGKGGVGKSTSSVNLALALAADGATVGLLDADIYGPSQPQLLGVAGQRPEVSDGKNISPIYAHGIQMISMGNLVTEKTPMIWRGPMASGALVQLLGHTRWQDVDYLVIDMPPGTGDIALTLAQKVPVTGAVVVSTPQDIALLDAKKGVEMFRKVDVPVLGVIENMAVHRCSNCGHEEHIFGEGGAERLAQEYGVEALGALPLSLNIRQRSDSGEPVVVSEADSPEALAYCRIARKAAAAIATQADDGGPEIIVAG
ncbi:iron-sulfur cluster carrier protein ApbC [Agaribacterium haliotis]|uniref:iron-sulfur cluster carrier protein ApbC n=1 Tax=Agaribacterium haliotis TaxID=2013869 RepID=UPI000BB53A20|nr:iron-sulfur cluster carrier protein ApbC [Agaribacterium haliotis]